MFQNTLEPHDSHLYTWHTGWIRYPKYSKKDHIQQETKKKYLKIHEAPPRLFAWIATQQYPCGIFLSAHLLHTANEIIDSLLLWHSMCVCFGSITFQVNVFDRFVTIDYIHLLFSHQHIAHLIYIYMMWTNTLTNRHHIHTQLHTRCCLRSYHTVNCSRLESCGFISNIIFWNDVTREHTQ